MKRVVLLVLLVLLSSVFLTSCFSVEKDVSNDISYEELILINAEKTKKIQQEVFREAVSVLDELKSKSGLQLQNTSTSMPDLNDPEAVEAYIDQLDVMTNALPTEDREQLESELQELTTYYENQIPPVIEDAFLISAPSGMYETRDLIIIGDDMIIDKRDPDLALFISNLIRSSKGLPIIEESSDSISPTAVYSTVNFGGNILWNDGKVYYRYSIKHPMSASDKQIMQQCMQDWAAASAGKVSFHELSSTWWRRFAWTIGVSKHVRVQKKVLDSAGNASIGQVAWASLSIDPECMISTIILHEMGHVLGLKHEHQRPDRDKYIKLVPENIKNINNYAILDTSWGKVITKSTSYDYLSIMHYPNSDKPYNSFTDLNGNYIPTGGLVISPIDAEFIKRLY